MVNRKDITDVGVMDYKTFMYDENNVRKCDGCPENKGMASDASGNRLPCGQYNCWVSVHCQLR